VSFVANVKAAFKKARPQRLRSGAMLYAIGGMGVALANHQPKLSSGGEIVYVPLFAIGAAAVVSARLGIDGNAVSGEVSGPQDNEKAERFTLLVEYYFSPYSCLRTSYFV